MFLQHVFLGRNQKNISVLDEKKMSFAELSTKGTYKVGSSSSLFRQNRFSHDTILSMILYSCSYACLCV